MSSVDSSLLNGEDFRGLRETSSKSLCKAADHSSTVKYSSAATLFDLAEIFELVQQGFRINRRKHFNNLCHAPFLGSRLPGLETSSTKLLSGAESG